MSLDVTNISQQIKTKLQGVGWLHDVYTYEPDKPDNGKYPFASIVIAEGDGVFGDTIRNVRTYKFQVNMYQERTNFNNSRAEGITNGVIDEILTAFDADTTLSGMVKMVKPLSFNTSYEDREIGDTRVAQFIIEATTVVPSIT